MIKYSISWTSERAVPTTSEARDPLAEGTAAQRRGDLEAAVEHYVRALEARPHRSLASYNLGVALIDAGLGLTSMPFLRRARLLQPSSETYAHALLFGLLRSDRLEAARRLLSDQESRDSASERLGQWRNWLTSCAAGRDPATLGLTSPEPLEPRDEPPDRAPDLPTASPVQAKLQAAFAQAMQDYQAGRMEKLATDLTALLAQHPDWGEGHHLRGLATLALKQPHEAVQSLQRASELLPGRAELWDHLGVAQARLGDEEGVRDAFEQALSLNPLRAESWNNAADSALSRGRPEQAFQYALQAVRLKPELTESSYCLLQAAFKIERAEREQGAMPDSRGRLLEIAVGAAKGCAQDPERSLAISRMLARIGQYADAVEVLERSLARFGNRPPRLLGELLFNQRHLCDWRHWNERVSILVEAIKQGEQPVASPFSVMSIPELEPADLLGVARLRAAEYRTWVESGQKLPRAAPRAPGSRLRLGYLSDDLQEHATAYLTAALFERHDRARFEFFAYSSGPDDGGPMRKRLRKAFEHFVDIGPMSPLEAAQRIRADGIDILVDLKGYTTNARIEILALRPAPIQVSWLGFPGSLGATFVDYLIVDPVVVPAQQAPHYDEALAYLPDAYAPVDDGRRVAERPTRAEAGLPATGFVFCCFNDPYKITPEVFARWCSLLQAVPESYLWLYAKSEGVTDNLVRGAADRGIPSGRLVFARKKPQAEHLARIALADLVLDTQPYNAHTTASDALWMGVPVLTCIGETFPSRVAASLLRASGLPELVTTGLDDYEERARWLAGHPEELAAFRQRLAAAKGHAAFFDTARFARNLEAVYRRIWDRHLKGLPPAQLDAQPI